MRDLTDLRAAVVGTGFIGVVHVDALRRLGVQVLGIVGSSPERARAKSGPVPLPEPYDSFEEMLADDRIDVVHLTTPNQLHYAQARAALGAGKHVVCEKPLTIDSEQSAELVELAQRSGLVHCTNFNIRFYPQCQEARAQQRSPDAPRAAAHISVASARSANPKVRRHQYVWPNAFACTITGMWWPRRSGSRPLNRRHS